MRPWKSFPPDTTERMEMLLAASSFAAESRRIQSVYLRAKYGYGAEKIAKMLGLKLQTVRNIHSAFLKNGEAALKLSGKGGRKNSHLEFKVEAAFLADFEEEAISGGKRLVNYMPPTGRWLVARSWCYPRFIVCSTVMAGENLPPIRGSGIHRERTNKTKEIVILNRQQTGFVEIEAIL